MKLVMTLLVRDEQDILKANLEFHLAQGVDLFIVTDNNSVDASKEILQPYIQQGLVHYIFEAEDNYNQHAWVTRMARLAYTKFGADWVINNDADEFWWPITGNLTQTFNNIDNEFNTLIAQRHDFIPMEKNLDNQFYNNMQYRKVISLNPLGNPLPPKVAHHGSKKVIVKQGNHRIEGLEPLNTARDLIEILHFPIRSYSQFSNKIINGGKAYSNNTTLPKAIGKTWRKLYAEYQEQHNLHAYYAQQAYSKTRIQAELQQQLLIKDTRLVDFFKTDT